MGNLKGLEALKLVKVEEQSKLIGIIEL